MRRLRGRTRARRLGGRRRSRRLGLDLGGVLITPFMPGFARRVAERTGGTPEEFVAWWNEGFRDAYWSGALGEDELWTHLGARGDLDSWRTLVALEPLPAMDRLAEWEAVADVWIISNHRHEWVDPLLARHGVRDIAGRVLVSSRTGLVKPGHRALEQLVADGTDPRSVMMVDDQARNLEAAADLGMVTVLADDDGDWTVTVDDWLGQD